MEYYFDQLDPVKFQQLVNVILLARFGEDARLTPLRGQDGGRDGETAPNNPYFEFKVTKSNPLPGDIFVPPRKGRYLFQVKHHRTTDKRISDIRQAVVSDFAKEMQNNVLKREGSQRVNYFILITNVPSSRDALEKIDYVRFKFQRNNESLYADVWWQERVVSYLDQMPFVWSSFPELFPGGVVPILAKVVDKDSGGLPRVVRLAIDCQYERDKNVKFRQIELEQSLSKLFVDLDIYIGNLSPETQYKLQSSELRRKEKIPEENHMSNIYFERQPFFQSAASQYLVSALSVLLDDDKSTSIRKLILEGGPGQGKSTITQMAIQLYRRQILRKHDDLLKYKLPLPGTFRLPFRIELRKLAEWFQADGKRSVDEYLVSVIQQDSGGNQISVDDLHSLLESSPVLLIFDGLDEIGSDKLRDDILNAIMVFVHRLESGLQVNLRVIITTRPPALTGRRETLIDFERLSLAPMEKPRIKEYLNRWLSAQIHENEERERIRDSFMRRQNDPHVQALARNPMQLSVLLQFIRLKGEAFPDRRAELYRDYFQIVIDRDVEKSPQLRENRDVIEALHEYLGYKIHALTEVNQADRTLERKRLISMVEDWLTSQGRKPRMAKTFFKLGEERFGLIVATKGEGEETKYGYEVQPIQEYFSAAFISNQITPNCAHDVFESMIRRPYWIEVALFLAGLRRPNEKADLVARAKEVDLDSKLGWYQDGRAIVLQLLQEGVFSEPRYVFSQALDFELDLLDANKIRVQRKPRGFLGALRSLVNQSSIDQHKQRIRQLLHDYSSCSDENILMPIYFIASQLLSSDDFMTAAMSYQGDSPYLMSLVRLGWPYRYKVEVESFSKNDSFWEGVPDTVWADRWWKVALQTGNVLALSVPVSLHHHLVEKFASYPTYNFLPIRRKQPFIEIQSRLAIWTLVRQQQKLQFVAEEMIYSDKSMMEGLILTEIDESSLSYEGLDEPLGTAIKDMIMLSQSFLVALLDKKRIDSTALKNFVEGINEYLKYPGIISWVACRYAVILIRTLSVGEMRSRWSENFLRLNSKKALKILGTAIRPFYEDSSKKKKEVDIFKYLLQNFAEPTFHSRNRIESVPNCVRLEKEKVPTPLVRLLVEKVRNGAQLPFKWLETMTWTTETIRPLIEKCRDCLQDLFLVINDLHFVHFGTKTRLIVQDTQRILKIARDTEDYQILKGITTVLQTASFLRIAKPNLILKLLRVDSTASLESIIFKIFETQIDRRDSDLFNKEIKTVTEVARGVIDVPEQFPFRTVCQAADFLAEQSKINLPPLLEEEEKLGIRSSTN